MNNKVTKLHRMETKAQRRKEFYKKALIAEAKEKLNLRDFKALNELLNKLKEIKRNGE